MTETAESTRLPVVVIDPESDPEGAVAELLGTAETLRVTLTLRSGEKLYGRITELIVDGTTDRLRWIGWQRETDMDPDRGTLVERVRWDEVAHVARREPLPLVPDADPPIPDGMVRIAPSEFSQALLGRRAVVLTSGARWPAGQVTLIQRGVDPAGGDLGYWDVQITQEDREIVDSYVVVDTPDSGLLVAEE